jgi:hypothetical protein
MNCYFAVNTFLTQDALILSNRRLWAVRHPLSGIHSVYRPITTKYCMFLPDIQTTRQKEMGINGGNGMRQLMMDSAFSENIVYFLPYFSVIENLFKIMSYLLAV